MQSREANVANKYEKTVDVTGLRDGLYLPNKQLFENLKSADKVLDLGCGDGAVTKYLKTVMPKDASIVAVDFNDSMVEKAKEKGINARQADAANLPEALLKGQFSLIWSLSTFHWVPDAAKLVTGLAKALKKDGHVVAEFAYESPPGLKRAIANVLRANGYNDLIGRKSDPWRRTYAKEWRTLLQERGFSKEKISIKPVARSQPLVGEGGMLKWLKTFADPFISIVPEDKRPEIRQKIVNELKEPLYKLYKKGTPDPWHITYNRLAITAQKTAEMKL